MALVTVVAAVTCLLWAPTAGAGAVGVEYHGILLISTAAISFARQTVSFTRGGGAAGLLAAAPEQPVHYQDVVIQPSRRPLGAVILAHPGGLVFGRADDSPIARSFAWAGFRVRVVDYPLGTLPGARHAMSRAVRAEKRRGGRVYLVGESAGGTLVEDATTRHRVSRAIAVAPVSDFTHWAYATPEYERAVLRMSAREASPLYGGRPKTPVTVFHSRQDSIVPFRQSRRYVRRQGGQLRELSGDHLADHTWIGRAIRSFRRDVDVRERLSGPPATPPN